MKRPTRPLHTAVATAVLASAGMSSFSALAASHQRPDASARAQIQQTYKAERLACLNGSSSQERRPCLAEAEAVRKEALNGVLGMQTVAKNQMAVPTKPVLLANALARCDVVPGDVRNECERRVNGGNNVIVTGSVAEGVIVRELIPEAVPMLVAQIATRPSAETGNLSNQPLIEGQPTSETAQAAAGSFVAPIEQPVALGAETAEAQSLSAGETVLSAESVPISGMNEALTEPNPASEAAALIEVPQTMPETPVPVDSADLNTPAIQSRPAASAAAAGYPEWMLEQRFD